MTVCFFGIYDRHYSRNNILIKGLRQNGINIIECNATEGKIGKYWTLFIMHWKIRKSYDAMIVAFPGYQAVILARLITRKLVVLDAFFSIYDSEVCDRRSTKPKTPAALYYWLLDWLACGLADKVLLDTDAHINYFRELFHFKKEKFIRVLLGADDRIIERDRQNDRDYLLVHFHGIATPLQGVDYIVRAARLLADENIKFNLVGSKIRRYPKQRHNRKINFIDTMSYRDLMSLMSVADICLGIFGDSRKTQVVIPNKVYEALAVGKAVITADTPAVREVLTDRENCLLCRAGDSRDLADKIIMLNKDDELRRQIAANGRQLFIDKLTPVQVTLPLVLWLKRI